MNRLRVNYELPPLLQATRALAQAGLAPIKHLLGSDERRRLLAEFEASNERLDTDFGVRFDSALPANEPAYAVEDLDAGFTLQLLGGLSQARTTKPAPAA
jgi:hypothetical protein